MESNSRAEALVVAAYAIGAGARAALMPSHPEAVDGVALATKTAEPLGRLFAFTLSQLVGGHWSLTRQEVSP